MGGKLFNCSRMNNDKFAELKSKIERVLTFNGIGMYFPYQLSDKKSHGDIDIVVACDFNMVYNAVVKSDINVIEHKGNSILCSDGKFKYQIDVIETEWENIDFAADYYSFGDMNNFIGKIASWYGFKLKIMVCISN